VGVNRRRLEMTLQDRGQRHAPGLGDVDEDQCAVIG
jgi:hypothetical protein